MKVDIHHPASRYRVIYADPAWKFGNRNTGGSMNSSAEAHYTVTSIEDMAALPVANLADEHCLLVMWWVGAMPQEAIDLCRAWGFRLVNMNGFVWRKLTKAKRIPVFGMGHATRAGSESALIGVRGKLAERLADKGKLLIGAVILLVVAVLPMLAAMVATALVFFRGAAELAGREAA